MIETITHNNCILAIIIRGDHCSEGIQFFTPEDFSQQLAYMNRPAGYKIPPHFHNELHRKVIYTHEVLFVRKGKVKVDFYDENQIYLESRLLQTGDVILLASGGHGFEMLDRTEMIEVKQGPYAGDKDKIRFEPKEL
jgi:mannose-6-phosphate isomerase-like protein (cupin superfamily)